MSISCKVITPVGPGHEMIVERAKQSVLNARFGPFRELVHEVVYDPGVMGRSAARNSAMWDGWMFFLDADDEMMPDACENVDMHSPATFGAICLNGEISKHNVHPCGWDEIVRHGAKGTLCMGFFYKGNLRFDESMDAGEDFDFYMRLPFFTKVKKPLVNIGYDVESAHGPRGYKRLDWHGVCRKVVDSYLGKDGGR